MNLSLLKYSTFLLLSFSLISSCKFSGESTTLNENFLRHLHPDTSIRHSKRFSILENEKCRVIYLFGNVNIKDTTSVYVILKDTTLNIQKDSRTYVIKPPCRRIASLSSVYTSMFVLLGELNNIAAIENIDYYTNPEINNRFNAGKLEELSRGPQIDAEKTIVLNPDVVFSFGMGNPEKELDRKLLLAGIPIVVAVDHLEETPLARAEWIKFFAAFVDKKQIADSIFNRVETNYKALIKTASIAKEKPTVLTEIKLGEIWYVPGGRSFAAKFIKDANADYVWSDNEKSGSLHLGFEEVFARAKNAEYWLNMAMIKSSQELLAQEPRYAEFNAFKKGNLYNNIKTLNKKGYSDYWETGIIFPDRVLSDLIRIFHPELRDSLNKDLFYYVKLE